MPESASGTIASVTAGIATALASAETSENCWNNASVAGTRPIVTTHCVRVPSRSVRRTRSRHDDAGFDAKRPQPAKSKRPTAPNDSQNPGASDAHGSQINTVTSDHSHTAAAVPGRPSHSPHAPTTSINSVRTAGTSAPARST